MTIGNRQLIKRGPEKAEGVAMVIECLVGPLFRQRRLRVAQLKRPYLLEMFGVPATQITDNRGVVYSRLLAQFTKSGFCAGAISCSYRR